MSSSPGPYHDRFGSFALPGPHAVQAIARHSDVKITLQIYAHTSLSAMREALDKMDGWLS